MRETKVCVVTGKNIQGYPVRIIVEARGVFEAAARALLEMPDGHRIVSNLKVSAYEPSKEFPITTEQVAEWAARRSHDDNIGIFALKNRVLTMLG